MGAACHLCPHGPRLVQGLVHLCTGGGVDQRANQDIGLTRITNRDGLVDAPQFRNKGLVNAFMHDQAAQRGAALSGCPDGGKGDAAQRQIQIG